MYRTSKTEFLERHNINEAAAYIHWKECQRYKIEVPKRCYQYKPKTVTEIEYITILWNTKKYTDRELSANMPDIGSDQAPRQPMLQAYRCVSIK